ncbi:hypothetical protein JCM3770_004519 [Rhodotorula araucariae]
MHTKSSLLLALAAAATAATAPSPHLESRDKGETAALPHWKEARLAADGFTSSKWVAGFQRAKAVVAGLTLEQKLNFTALGADSGGCSARTYPLSDGSGAEPFQLCMADGPTGINSRYSTQFPAQVTTAATWSIDLFHARAAALATEYRAIGALVPLSIVAGPLGRGVYGGRNWEGFSPDPYLSGEAVRVTVEGFQDQGVTGLVKHFVGNEQEWLRVGSPAGGYFDAFLNQTTDSIVDAATLRESYAWPFAEAVRAGSGSFMCSYNLLNGTSACESDELINQLLKQELNFHGWVLTDWGAGHTTAGTALNGTDWVAAGSAAGNLFGDKLGAYIKNGSVPAEIVDDKLIRMLTPYYALNQSSLPSIDFNRWVANSRSADIARKLSVESITLLKNIRSANDTRGLPLNKPRDLLLVGSGAAPAPYGYISNLNTAVYYAPSNDYTGWNTDPGLGRLACLKEETPVHVDYFAQDDPRAGWVYTALGQNISYLGSKLEYANTAIVFVTAVAMEGFDRTTLQLQNNGDELIEYVAGHHDDTVVVITAPGPEGGHALASVLFGDVNPSGKLPFTIAKNVSDYDAGAHFNGSVSYQPKIKYDEGIFTDYRYFDQKGIKPLFEFGFGMSYSTFEISGLAIAPNATKVSAPVRETNEKFFINDEQVPGLYDVAYSVTAQVVNTGEVAGAEVAQLYLGFPDSTPNKMPLRNKDLAVWDVIRGGWVLPKGEFKLMIGSSSRTAAATATFTV